MRVLIVDDHRLFLEGMRHLVKQLAPKATITTTESVQHAIGYFDQGLIFDLIMMDLSLPGIGGMSFLKSIRARKINAPVIVVSASESMDDVHRILDNGAMGFIPKSNSLNDMTIGVKTVLAGDIYLPPDLWTNYNPNWKDQEVSTEQSGFKLGKRQLRVLALMSEGLSNKQIASVLGVSEATVKYHVGLLFKALRTRRRTACIQQARKLKLLPDSA